VLALGLCCPYSVSLWRKVDIFVDWWELVEVSPSTKDTYPIIMGTIGVSRH